MITATVTTLTTMSANDTEGREACNGFDTCIQAVIGGVGGLVLIIILVIMTVSVVIAVYKKKKKAKYEQKKTEHETLKTRGPYAVNQQDLNQPSDTYSREFGEELSSHNYASIHLPGINITNAADLEKGGRYTQVANQNQINNYAEINNPTPTNEQAIEIIPTHGYDVPKPQNKALQPPLSATWVPVQSYETPEEVVGPKKSKTKPPSSRNSSNDDIDDEYVQPHLLRRPCDAADMPVYANREVSSESTSSSNVPQLRERHSPRAEMSTHTHGSGDRLEKLPQKHQFPSYENIDKDGFIIGQAPVILNAMPENLVDSNAAKLKSKIPDKIQLKKPALPSKLFKPTAELKQIQEANSKERKCRFEPLTPKDTDKKSMYDHPKPARSQTWTLDSKLSVNRKPPRASNYTPIDPTKLDPDNDYEPL